MLQILWSACFLVEDLYDQGIESWKYILIFNIEVHENCLILRKLRD